MKPAAMMAKREGEFDVTSPRVARRAAIGPKFAHVTQALDVGHPPRPALIGRIQAVIPKLKISRKVSLSVGCAAAYAAASSLILTMSYGPGTATPAAAAVPMTIANGEIAKGLRFTIGSNESLARLLSRAGASDRDIETIVAQTRAALPQEVAPGAIVDIVFDGFRESPNITKASIRARLDLAIDFTRTRGELVASQRPIDVYQTPLRVYGHVKGDLRSSLSASHVPTAAIDDYIRILAPHLSAGSVNAGDAFDLVIDQHRTARGEVSNGGLMYVGLYQANGNDLELSQWTKDGKLKWYEASRVGQSSETLQRPVPGDVTSRFGQRFHPILGFSRMHKGLDFHAAKGTPILAIQTGWVEKAGWAGGYGKQVALQHGDRYETTYSHMSSVIVRPGELVQQGQVIGYVGDTGLATGPHLHFEVHHNGEAINPASVPFHTRPQLTGEDLVGYQKRLKALLAVPVGLTNIRT